MLTKVFASNEPEQDRYQWTDSDYLKGLEILGNEAPSKAMFNALFRQEDEKINILSDKVDEIDYKDVEKLRKYVSDKGKILPRRATGACAKHQRDITLAIKRARQIAVLPYTQE